MRWRDNYWFLQSDQYTHYSCFYTFRILGKDPIIMWILVLSSSNHSPFSFQYGTICYSETSVQETSKRGCTAQ